MPPKDEKAEAAKQAGRKIQDHGQLQGAHGQAVSQSQADFGGRAIPPTGEPAPATALQQPRVPTQEPVGTLEAHIQINDQQFRILEADQQFQAFMRQNNSWARIITDPALVARLEEDYQGRLQRRANLLSEVEAALSRAGNTEPAILQPARELNPRAMDFRPAAPVQQSQVQHSRQASLQSQHSGPQPGHSRSTSLTSQHGQEQQGGRSRQGSRTSP